ncbi:MAG: hypothetical protein KA716_21320 [Gloeotrichia echinulata DEX184]|nr:hypothetical protein [Gloeotrichia echinulata DEX184]
MGGTDAICINFSSNACPHKHFTPPLNPRTASSPGKFCLDIAGDWGHNDRSVHRWGLGYKSDCV